MTDGKFAVAVIAMTLCVFVVGVVVGQAGPARRFTAEFMWRDSFDKPVYLLRDLETFLRVESIDKDADVCRDAIAALQQPPEARGET